MSIEDVGCCGAYCGTCNVIRDGLCKGCKSGYTDGTRDISRAKCKMKVCCLENQFCSCADCSEYSSCDIIQNFYAKRGYKYKKYREAIEFIRASGYEDFLKIADGWKMQYGKLK
jgi:hypothetical protein